VLCKTDTRDTQKRQMQRAVVTEALLSSVPLSDQSACYLKLLQRAHCMHTLWQLCITILCVLLHWFLANSSADLQCLT